ncbi:MAG: tetratricopeptide repeat protein, partial [Myxococcales bacterium]
MSIDPKELEKLNRDELIAKAQQLGAIRPELLTRPELRDEIIRLSESDESERRRARGWFGVARDLVASVVNQGLNLPDAVDLIRSANVLSQKDSPPVATVTLAEIYAAQGHVRKALDLLDEVLANEPDHEAARLARSRWSQQPPNGVRGANSGDTGKERTPVEVPELQEVTNQQDPGSGAASGVAEVAVTDVTAPRTDAGLDDRASLDATTECSPSVDVAVPPTSSGEFVEGAVPSTSSDGFMDVAVSSTSSSPPPAQATKSDGEEVSEAVIGAGAEGALVDVPADSERSPRAMIDVIGAPIELHAASAQQASPLSGRVAMMPDNMVEPAAP